MCSYLYSCIITSIFHFYKMGRKLLVEITLARHTKHGVSIVQRTCTAFHGGTLIAISVLTGLMTAYFLYIAASLGLSRSHIFLFPHSR